MVYKKMDDLPAPIQVFVHGALRRGQPDIATTIPLSKHIAYKLDTWCLPQNCLVFPQHPQGRTPGRGPSPLVSGAICATHPHLAAVEGMVATAQVLQERVEQDHGIAWIDPRPHLLGRPGAVHSVWQAPARGFLGGTSTPPSLVANQVTSRSSMMSKG
jgi:hypothetical protein